MAKVLLKSKAKDIIIRRSNPRINLKFKDKPKKVDSKVADILIKDFPGMFEIVEKMSKRELTKKDKDRIEEFKEDLADDGKRNYSNRKKKVNKE